MKKKLSFILAAIFGLAFIMLPFFALCKNSTTFTAEAATNGETEFFIEGNSFDLISKNPSGNIGNCTIESGVAPFDPETKSLMDGSIITPAADEYGQILNPIGIKINNYTPAASDVIYLWVYLIDTTIFKLKFSLNSGSSEGISWEFGSNEVYEMGTGWKILALPLSKFSADDLKENYNILSVSYYAESEDYVGEEDYEKYEIKAKENFSIFHAFVTKNVNSSQKSGIVYSLGKSYYKFSNKFNISKTVFIGDKIKINSANELFEYLYVGKYDLSTYTTSGRYFWSLSLKSPDASSGDSVEFGEEISFAQNGYYVLNISLYENRTYYNLQILNEDISIYCDELSLGFFLMGSIYKIKDNEKIQLTFKLTDGITILSDLSVSTTNNNAAIESYYQEDGVVYVMVSGVSKGRSEVEVSAKAISNNGVRAKEFSAVASIKIENSEESTDIFIVILWITFGCFCAFFVVFLVISLVKARKNDVK